MIIASKAYDALSTDKPQASDSEHVELTVKDEKDGDNISTITETEAEKDDDIVPPMTEIPMECKRNIYNLFLIANYRNDPRLNLKEHKQINKKIRFTLGALAYLTALAQWLGFGILFMVTILSSDRPENEWYFSFGTKHWNLWMYPFWIIALIFAWKEISESKCDQLILVNWGIKAESISDCSCCRRNRCKTFQFYFFKVLTEKYFGYAGSLSYFTVLAAFSNGDEWERVLETIFRLIEFQFILEAKDWAFSMFERPMKVWLAQTSDNFLDFDINDVFEGEMTLERVKGKHTAHRSLPVSMWPIVYVVAWSFYLQAFYTMDLVFFIVAGVIFLVWIVWCLLAYFLQK